MAVTFSELLLLKGFYDDAKEFYKLIIAEHDQLDFTAHFGIFNCEAKVKSNFELLAIKKSYYEYYSSYFDNVREAEEEAVNNGKLERRIFTEFDSFHEELLDLNKSRSNFISALNQAATLCEKNLILVTPFDTLYYASTGMDRAINAKDKFAISELVYRESSNSVQKISVKSTYNNKYESNKVKSNVKLFDKTQAINFKVELIILVISAFVGLAVTGMVTSNYMEYGFPLAFAIIFGFIAICCIIILISIMKEKCCDDFDTENICGSCLGWYFGGGIAIGLVVAIVAGIFMGLGYGGAYLINEMGLGDLPLSVTLLIPYVIYKVIDIIKKRKFMTVKYFVFSAVMLFAGYVLFGIVLQFGSMML